MSLIQKTSPVGVDEVIDRITDRVYYYLVTNSDGPQWNSYEAYPRVYKNLERNRTYPEHYTGSGDYIDVLFNDDFNATSFVLADDNASYSEGQVEQNISIVFQGKLDELYPNISHRADAEMHQDIVTGIKEAGYWEKIQDVVTGFPNVLSDLSVEDVKAQDMDMSERHIVKVDLTITYINIKCLT